jgi:hypothetical protein
MYIEATHRSVRVKDNKRSCMCDTSLRQGMYETWSDSQNVMGGQETDALGGVKDPERKSSEKVTRRQEACDGSNAEPRALVQELADLIQLGNVVCPVSVGGENGSNISMNEVSMRKILRIEI